MVIKHINSIQRESHIRTIIGLINSQWIGHLDYLNTYIISIVDFYLFIYVHLCGVCVRARVCIHLFLVSQFLMVGLPCEQAWLLLDT